MCGPQALALGITRFEMTAGLNDSPTFIAALANLVMAALGMDHNCEVDRLVAAN